ncbi:hypothetical protein J4711_14735 [Staphylococcus epidermidis]|nr:hypothetical protein [Staphylococcus epidermidis]
MKNLVSALLTATAGSFTPWAALCSGSAAIMMVAATLGYLGARVARKIPAHILRWGIASMGR